MEKLHISLIFSNLEVKTKTLNYISLMHNFIAKFYKILDVCNYASVMNIKEFYEDNIGKSFTGILSDFARRANSSSKSGSL